MASRAASERNSRAVDGERGGKREEEKINLHVFRSKRAIILFQILEEGELDCCSRIVQLLNQRYDRGALGPW